MKLLYLFVFMLSFWAKAQAWDDISHAWITRLAIQYIDDPALKDLMQRYQKQALAGSWYPDWEKFVRKQLPGMNHHKHIPFGKAYLAHLREDDVKRQSNYSELLAHCFGSLGHVMQDHWFDLILQQYLATKDKSINGDVEIGVMNIQRHHMGRRLHVDSYYPVEDLTRVYSSYEYFRDQNISHQEFERNFKKGSRIEHFLMTGLRLTSFFFSRSMERKMSWAAANMMDAPGGLISTAKATAKYWEVLYASVTGQSMSLAVHAEFDPIIGGGNLITHPELGQDSFDQASPYFVGEDGKHIPAQYKNGRYPSAIVRQFVPSESLQPGSHYCFVLPSRSELINVNSQNDLRLDFVYQLFD